MTGFESQKVRGLLAYLALARDHTFSRDHLAALLWPDGDEDAARRNLRQAIYNLRQIVDPDPGAEPLLDVSRQSVCLASGNRLWLDVDELDDHLSQARALSRDEPRHDPGVERSLAGAARLYRGDLLAGFHVGDSSPFQEWLLAEQERLREAAIDALVRLMDLHMDAGTYTLGVEYGHKLLEIDPLSETAHRKLMRLHAFAGRRSRAIADYQALERLLADELGVEPLEETRALYQAIVAEEIPGTAVRELAEPVGPLVPLAGRHEALEHLAACWRTVCAGSGRLTLVTGEPGIGKTRLVKTFLHRATSESAALVLQGRGQERVPPVPYAGLAQALNDAVTHEMEVAERLLERLAPARLAVLSKLVPALRELRPDDALPRVTAQAPGALAEAVAAALVALTYGAPGAEGSRRPAILFLDDLQAGDRATLRLLGDLRELLRHDPVWMLGTWSARSAEEVVQGVAPPGATSPAPPDAVDDTIALERLSSEDLLAVAEGLVPKRHRELASLLAACDGLPLAVTETINWLWDEGLLREHQGGEWSLETVPTPEAVPTTLEAIVQARLAELPTSTRRLFTLAAVAGPEVDAALLEAAEREHGVVVDTGIRVLLERWMGRLRLGYWADSRRERDVSLWTSGTRRRTFEFAHPLLREIVYGALDPERRALLHRRVAEAFEDRLPLGAGGRPSEILGFHYALGRSWARALPHLEAAAESALDLGAPDTAAWYRDRAAEALKALGEERPDELAAWKDLRAHWQELGDRIRAAAACVDPAP